MKSRKPCYKSATVPDCKKSPPGLLDPPIELSLESSLSIFQCTNAPSVSSQSSCIIPASFAKIAKVAGENGRHLSVRQQTPIRKFSNEIVPLARIMQIRAMSARASAGAGSGRTSDVARAPRPCSMYNAAKAENADTKAERHSKLASKRRITNPTMDALILTGRQNRGASGAAILTFSLVGSLGSQSHLVFALSLLLRSL